MIYTLTFFPALDLWVKLNKLNLGKTNYAFNQDFRAGGKGINVSFALNKFNVETTAIGFVGGFGAKFIKNELDNFNISNYLIDNGINTRINIKIEEELETEINGMINKVDDDSILKLKKYLLKLKKDDILIISGRADEDNIISILEFIKDKNIKLVLDTKNFINLLKFNPVLIKPNKIELEEALNVKLNNEEDILNSLIYLKKLGAKNILLSLGEDGAYLYNGNLYKKEAIKLKSITSTVGAGDTMLAGFIYKYLNSNNLKEALDFSVLAGSAKAKLGYFPNIEEVMGLKKEE